MKVGFTDFGFVQVVVEGRKMKLKPKLLRYMTTEEFRVLTAVEIGSKNHDVVPLELISSIAGLRHGGVHKFISNLLRNKLVAHDRKHYDGYRLTYSGYDYLALRTFVKRGTIVGIGRQIGVGKESDIHVAQTAEGETVVMKLHRLGRVSFRAIKEKRDYHQGRASASWLYLSRLAAIKEFAFMKALHENGFPVPTPIDQNRHCCIMSLAPGYPMVQVRRLEEPRDVYVTHFNCLPKFFKNDFSLCTCMKIPLYCWFVAVFYEHRYRQCMSIIKRLARHGELRTD